MTKLLARVCVSLFVVVKLVRTPVRRWKKAVNDLFAGGQVFDFDTEDDPPQQGK